MPPETRYAGSGDVSIAYQVVGEGPLDLVFVPPSTSHVELGWDVPSMRVLREGLSSFARLIFFDKRGTGMSDRVAGAPTLETRMDDVRAVRGDERALRGDVPRTGRGHLCSTEEMRASYELPTIHGVRPRARRFG